MLTQCFSAPVTRVAAELFSPSGADAPRPLSDASAPLRTAAISAAALAERVTARA